MARTKNPDTNFKIAIHKMGKYRYAATQPLLVDPDTGKKIRHYVHWGTVTDDLVFIPGLRYKEASSEEKSKLIFPAGWTIKTSMPDLIQKGDELPPAGSLPPAALSTDLQYDNRLYGAIWLLEKLFEQSKVQEDLLTVFGHDYDLVDELFTLAIFPCLSKRNYDRVAAWQRTNKTPAYAELTPSYITRFTQKITDNHRMNFLKLRLARQKSNALVACDSTTRSAWGRHLADIHWGHNKDNPTLENTVEVVVYSLDTHEPVYYRTFAGNVSDLRTVRTILSDLRSLGVTDLTVIFDRGYESMENMDELIEEDTPFLMCAKVKQSPVFPVLESIEYDPQGLPVNMQFDDETELYYVQRDITHVTTSQGKSVTLKCNLYLNLLRRIVLLQKLKNRLEEERTRGKKQIAEFEGKELSPENLRRFNADFTYFKLTKSNNGGKTSLSLTAKNDLIEKERATAGFFSSLAYDVQGDAKELYRTYKLRDEQEKYFELMKDQMGFNLQRNSSEAGKTGRLFILFIGLILLSKVRWVWQQKLRKEYISSMAILDEMESIRYVEYPDGSNHVTSFTTAQVDICSAFGVEPPAGCLSECQKHIQAIKAAGRKRGRPRKIIQNSE